jgi:hypothetical protein
MSIARAVVVRKGLEDASPFVQGRVKGITDAAQRRRESLAERVGYGRRRVGWRVAA